MPSQWISSLLQKEPTTKLHMVGDGHRGPNRDLQIGPSHDWLIRGVYIIRDLEGEACRKFWTSGAVATLPCERGFVAVLFLLNKGFVSIVIVVRSSCGFWSRALA